MFLNLYNIGSWLTISLSSTSLFAWLRSHSTFLISLIRYHIIHTIWISLTRCFGDGGGESRQVPVLCGHPIRQQCDSTTAGQGPTTTIFRHMYRKAGRVLYPTAQLQFECRPGSSSLLTSSPTGIWFQVDHLSSHWLTCRGDINKLLAEISGDNCSSLLVFSERSERDPLPTDHYQSWNVFYYATWQGLKLLVWGLFSYLYAVIVIPKFHSHFLCSGFLG